ncbi:MAG TPA: hypothetical protein VHV82_03355 [Sporichthyaceae bacterium]|nr:hypothetical protein [Sporichthyaceae bacterium]
MTIVVLVIAYAALWLLARPSGVASGSFVGQLLGAESVLLLSIGLVLISTLPWVEEWFDGIDRAAIWHRRVAITGLLLLGPHVLLASNRAGTTLGAPLGVIGLIGMVALAVWAILPRWRSIIPRRFHRVITLLRATPGVGLLRIVLGGYERWRALHRTTGLFLAAGFVHGLLDATPFPVCPVLRWSYVTIGATGLAFYIYRELVARHVGSLHDYQVATVAAISADLLEIVLRPIGRHMKFVPGQFAMVYLEAKDGWHRHPFTIASSPQEGVLRITVKALGDYTARLPDLVRPGMPAVIGGPHGRFNHTKGTSDQIWIAGGVGITPFLSWLRDLDQKPIMRRVDFFYTHSGSDAPFRSEIEAIAARHPTVHAHVLDTSTHGRLTVDQVLGITSASPRELSAFLCGPEGMVRTFQTGLRRAGVPDQQIHREYFDWR